MSKKILHSIGADDQLLRFARREYPFYTYPPLAPTRRLPPANPQPLRELTMSGGRCQLSVAKKGKIKQLHSDDMKI